MTFTFNEKTHRYFLDGKPLTGITTTLSVISKPALIGWAARMVGEHIRENAPTELFPVPEGETPTLECYKVSEALLSEAVEAHRRKKEKSAEQGTDIHQWIENWIKDRTIALPEDPVAKAQAEQWVNWAKNVEFLASEKKMYSEKHWIAGTCDFVAMVDGKKYVGDIKTYGKIWDRVPFLQMGGYLTMLEEMGEDSFEGAVVVNLPKDGGMEIKYSYDLEGDKQGFLSALTLYRTLQAYDPNIGNKLTK